MPFTLPPLPYAENALEPHISARTLSFHYGKHHQGYVTNLNNLIQNTDFEGQSLDQIILATANSLTHGGIFNNAAQHWNHSFYWDSLSPQGGGEPTGALSEQITKDFGSFDAFAQLFKQAATGQFGSGWAWLVMDTDGTLKVTKTPNADLPLAHGQKALLTCDVWEHAYYLDYQNRRPDYVEIFLKNLANWDFASKNFDQR